MDQSVCPSCWTWYPIGTRACRPCGVHLGGAFQAEGGHARRPREAQPSSVVWARGALILHAAAFVALFVYATSSVPAADHVFGPSAGAYLTHEATARAGTVTTLAAAGVIGGLVGLGVQLWLTRWIFGRMVLLLGVAWDVWFTLVTTRGNPQYLVTSIGLATTLLTAAMLGWSVARPNVR